MDADSEDSESFEDLNSVIWDSMNPFLSTCEKVKVYSGLVLTSIPISIQSTGKLYEWTLILIIFNKNESITARAALGTIFSVIQLTSMLSIEMFVEYMAILLSEFYAKERFDLYIESFWYLIVALIPLFAFYVVPTYLFADYFLELIGIEPAVGELVGQFTIYLLPTFFIYAVNLAYEAICYSQGIEKSLIVLRVAGFIVNAVLIYYTISVKKMGFLGIAISQFIAELVVLLFTLIFVKIVCKPQTLGFPKFNSFWKRFPPFLCECTKFTITSTIEHISYEVCMFFIIALCTTPKPSPLTL